MLNLRINDYKINSDTNNIILSKVIRDENGEIKFTKDSQGKSRESTKLVGYYATLDKALEGLTRHHLFTGDDEITTMQEYQKVVDTLSKDIQEQLKL